MRKTRDLFKKIRDIKETFHAKKGAIKGRNCMDFTFSFHFHALEKEMATHSGILAWKIPQSEPGRPQFMESQESDMI